MDKHKRSETSQLQQQVSLGAPGASLRQLVDAELFSELPRGRSLRPLRLPLPCSAAAPAMDMLTKAMSAGERAINGTLCPTVSSVWSVGGGRSRGRLLPFSDADASPIR